MAMLAGSVDGVIGVDTTATPSPPPPSPASAGCSPRPPPLPTPPATSGCSTSRACRFRAVAAGRWRGRQLRRRPGGVLAAARRAGRRGGSAQAASQPRRCQERRAGRGPGRPRGAGPGPPGDPTASGWAGGAAGAADHQALRHPGAGRCHRPAPRPWSWAPRRSCAPSCAAAAPPTRSGTVPACGPARFARWSTRPPCGRCGHRPAHPAPPGWGRPAAGRTHRARRRGRPVAAGGPRRRPR
jgi:hypothetical protein